MPKYYLFRIANHYLYFTSECIVEAMHVHASDRQMTEAYSAKFIKQNYLDMYRMWKDFGGGDFYKG